MRQALGAGCVLFRLSLGSSFLLFFFKPIPIFFFFFSFLFSLEVFIPYMVINIYHRRQLGLTPDSRASCIVWARFPSQPCWGLQDVQNSVMNPTLRGVSGLTVISSSSCFIWPQFLSSPPSNQLHFGDRHFVPVKWAGNLLRLPVGTGPHSSPQARGSLPFGLSLLS